MAKTLVFLQYTFLFDPANTWSHVSQFENALAEFFSQYGKEMEVIKSVGNGQNQKLLYIANKPAPVIKVDKKLDSGKAPAVLLKEMAGKK